MIEATIRGRKLQVLRSDLTRERVDAIVTAANRLLCGGNQAGLAALERAKRFQEARSASSRLLR